MVLMALVTSSGAPLQLISGHRRSAHLPPSLEYSAAGEFPSSPRSLTITALMATPLIFSKWLAAICSAHSWRVHSNRDRNRNREEPQRNREHPHRNRPSAHPLRGPQSYRLRGRQFSLQPLHLLHFHRTRGHLLHNLDLTPG